MAASSSISIIFADVKKLNIPPLLLFLAKNKNTMPKRVKTQKSIEKNVFEFERLFKLKTDTATDAATKTIPAVNVEKLNFL